MRQVPRCMRFFARSFPMSCLPCWWKIPTGTMARLSSYECDECKEGSVHLTLTTIFCRCQKTAQLAPFPKQIQLKQTASPKTAKKMFHRKLCNNYVFCVVYCLLCCALFVVYHSTVLCQHQMLIFFNKI